tara:strand:+ start:346 stop:549 length:204 start_codon:yes stop_codon:yes gene_type:complete
MLLLAHKSNNAMSRTLASKNRRIKMLRAELAGINDPFELLAEALADNERLRQIINNHDCHKGKPSIY